MPSNSRNSTWTHQIWVSYLFMILCKYIFHCFVSRLTKKTQFKIALANITPLHSHRENNNKANFSSQLKKKNLFCLFPWMQQSFSCCAQMLITGAMSSEKRKFYSNFANSIYFFHIESIFCEFMMDFSFIFVILLAHRH